MALLADSRSPVRHNAHQILETRKDGPDAFLVPALMHALYGVADAEQLGRALSHPSPRVRKAAMVLLDQPPHVRLSFEPVLDRLKSSDAELRRAAQGVLRRHPEWA